MSFRDPTTRVGKLHDQCADIRSISNELSRLAGSFYTTGNPQVGQRLMNMADRLEAVQQEIQEDQAEQIHREAMQAHTSTMQLAEAVIGGIGIGQRSKSGA